MASTDSITFPSKTHTHLPEQISNLTEIYAYNGNLFRNSTGTITFEGWPVLYVIPALKLFYINAKLVYSFTKTYEILDELPIYPRIAMNIYNQSYYSVSNSDTSYSRRCIVNIGTEEFLSSITEAKPVLSIGSKILYPSLTSSTTGVVFLQYLGKFTKFNDASKWKNDYTVY